MRILLDTNAYSALMRPEPPEELVETIQFAENVVLPATVLGELYAGFYRGGRFGENERILAEFLSADAVEVAPTDEETAIKFGRIEAELRKNGTPVPTNDIWIAAAAFQHGLTIVTFDRHFEVVPFVDVRMFGG